MTIWSKPFRVISVSQLDKSGFNSQAKPDSTSCQRQYVLETGYGLQKWRDSPASLLGKRVHSTFEKWLQDGTPPDPRTPEGAILQPGLKFWKNVQILALEKKYVFTLDWILPGLSYWGFIDVAAREVLGDHKTTGNIYAPYTLRDKDLPKDLQVNIYSSLEMQEQLLGQIRAQWVYYSTSGAIDKVTGQVGMPTKPAARMASAVINKADADAAVEQFLDDTAKLAQFRAAKPRWRDVPANKEHCGAFGGCAFQALCFGSEIPEDKMESIDFMSNLITKAQAEKAEAKIAQAAPAPVVMQAPAAMPVPPPPTVRGGMPTPAPLTVPGLPVPPRPVPPPAPTPAPAPAPLILNLSDYAVEAPAPVAPPAPAAPAIDIGGLTGPLASAFLNRSMKTPAAVLAPPAANVVEVPINLDLPVAEILPPAAAEPEKKRGRPKKITAKEPLEVKEVVVAAPAVSQPAEELGHKASMIRKITAKLERMNGAKLAALDEILE